MRSSEPTPERRNIRPASATGWPTRADAGATKHPPGQSNQVGRPASATGWPAIALRGLHRFLAAVERRDHAREAVADQRLELRMREKVERILAHATQRVAAPAARNHALR